MELLKTAKQRSMLSEAIYIALNLALAISVFIAVWAFESPLIALMIVLLSKWRVLAVRPRYWVANIQANLVDLIVSFSYVALLYYSQSLAAQLILTALYMAWLFFLKPRSKRIFMVIQAHVAVAVGVTALFNVAYAWPAALVVLAMWLIGYTTARHILVAYEESQLTFLSLTWGLIVAQLGWLAYHWSIAYELAGSGLLIAQVAVVVLFLGFLVERVYGSIATNGEIRGQDIILPALLSLSVIMVVQILFNSIGAGAI